MSSSLFEILATNYLFTNHICSMSNSAYIYKKDLALNNLKGLTSHKTQPTTSVYGIKCLGEIYEQLCWDTLLLQLFNRLSESVKLWIDFPPPQIFSISA